MGIEIDYNLYYIVALIVRRFGPIERILAFVAPILVLIIVIVGIHLCS